MKSIIITLLTATICMSVSACFAADRQTFIESISKQVSEHRYDDALQQSRAALDKFPKDAVLIALKADIYLQLKQYDKSLESARLALSIEPNYDWPQYLTALCLYHTNQLDEAFGHAQTIIKRATDKKLVAHSLILQGMIREKAGIYGEADFMYSQAIDLFPGEASYYELRAWNRRRLNQIKLGEQDLNKAVNLKPDNSRYPFALAAHYKDRRYYHKAISALKSAFKHDSRADNFELKNDFFYSTGLGGARLVANENVFFSAGGSFENTSAFSSDENLTRAVQAQSIDFSDPRKVPEPHSTRKSIYTINSGLLAGDWPLTHFNLRHEFVEHGKDKSIEHEIVDARVEQEYTFYHPILKDITLFPMYKYLFTEASNITAADILSDEKTKTDVHMVGARLLAHPIFSKLFLETGFFTGFGTYRESERDFTEYDSFEALTWKPDTQNVVYLFHRTYFSDQSDRGDSLRYEYILRWHRQLFDEATWLKFQMRVVDHKDYQALGIDPWTTTYEPSISLRRQLTKNIYMEGEYTHRSFEQLDLYDSQELRVEAGFRNYLSLPNDAYTDPKEGNRAPYEIYVGYKHKSYTHLPASIDPDQDAVYAGSRLIF